jgi:hypothetical protein
LTGWVDDGSDCTDEQGTHANLELHSVYEFAQRIHRLAQRIESLPGQGDDPARGFVKPAGDIVSLVFAY